MKHRATARDALSPAEVWVSAESRPRDMSAEIDAVGAVYAAVFEGDRWLGLVALHEAAVMGWGPSGCSSICWTSLTSTRKSPPKPDSRRSAG